MELNWAVADATGTKPGDVGTVDVGVGRTVVVVCVSVSVTVGVTWDVNHEAGRLTDGM